MKGDTPDYSYLVNLVKEVRDALHQMAPKGWKEEISNNINLEMLSQVRRVWVVLWWIYNIWYQYYYFLAERYLSRALRTHNIWGRFCSTLWLWCVNCRLLQRKMKWRSVMTNYWTNWLETLNLMARVQMSTLGGVWDSCLPDMQGRWGAAAPRGFLRWRDHQLLRRPSKLTFSIKTWT